MKHTILVNEGIVACKGDWHIKQQGIELKDVKRVATACVDLYGRDRVRLLKEIEIRL